MTCSQGQTQVERTGLLTRKKVVAALVLDTKKIALVPVTFVNTFGHARIEVPPCAIGPDRTGLITELRCRGRTGTTCQRQKRDGAKKCYDSFQVTPLSPSNCARWFRSITLSYYYSTRRAEIPALRGECSRFKR